MVFQQFNLVARLDVLTNVLMGRLSYQRTWRSLLKRASSIWLASPVLCVTSTSEWRVFFCRLGARRCSRRT